MKSPKMVVEENKLIIMFDKEGQAERLKKGLTTAFKNPAVLKLIMG